MTPPVVIIRDGENEEHTTRHIFLNWQQSRTFSFSFNPDTVFRWHLETHYGANYIVWEKVG